MLIITIVKSKLILLISYAKAKSQIRQKAALYTIVR